MTLVSLILNSKLILIEASKHFNTRSVAGILHCVNVFHKNIYIMHFVCLKGML